MENQELRFVWITEYRSPTESPVVAFVTSTPEKARELMAQNSNYSTTKGWFWALMREPVDVDPLKDYYNNMLQYYSPSNAESSLDHPPLI